MKLFIAPLVAVFALAGIAPAFANTGNCTEQLAQWHQAVKKSKASPEELELANHFRMQAAAECYAKSSATNADSDIDRAYNLIGVKP